MFAGACGFFSERNYVMNDVFLLASAYLLGAIPFGLFVAKQVKGIDIREHGSKNIGATNVGRVVGKKWGLFVFALDVLKGFLATQLQFASDISTGLNQIQLGMALAVFAIIGHSFPVWLRFKGGKGVATSLGVFLGLLPIPTLITFGVWLAVFFTSRIISISSLLAAVIFPLVVHFFKKEDAYYNLWLGIALILCIFMFYTHRQNIQRLKNGEEKKFF